MKKKIIFYEVKEQAADKFCSPSEIALLIRGEIDFSAEELWLICMDCKNQILLLKMIARGALNTVVIKPADIFRPLLIAGGERFIIAHNHPSGNCEPSAEDMHFTKNLGAAAKVMGITMLDHVIITEEGFKSLRAEGLIQE